MGVLVLFAVVGLVAVVVIGLVAVGSAVGRLRVEPSRNIFEHDEALEFVAQALPAELTAELSYEEVQRILRLHLDHLHAEGVARSGGDLRALERQPGPRVLDPEAGVRYVLDRAARVDYFPRPDAVRAVIEAQLAYFEAIGAVAVVQPPDLEEPEDPDQPPR
jgi:hypothetical protein